MGMLTIKIWCHTLSWKDWFNQVGSLVLFNRTCRKSTTGFSHAPLETAFSLHRWNTAWPPRLFQLPVIIASNFTYSKVILSGEVYRGNAADSPVRWNHCEILKFNPSLSNPLPTSSRGGVDLKDHLSCIVYLILFKKWSVRSIVWSIFAVRMSYGRCAFQDRPPSLCVYLE